MQCIEGRPDRIGRLIANIRDDDRNADVTVLLDRPVTDRSFAEWSMGFRVMSMPELRDEPGFHDLRDASDLFQVESADTILLSLMRTQYRIGYGRNL